MANKFPTWAINFSIFVSSNEWHVIFLVFDNIHDPAKANQGEIFTFSLNNIVSGIQRMSNISAIVIKIILPDSSMRNSFDKIDIEFLII